MTTLDVREKRFSMKKTNELCESAAENTSFVMEFGNDVDQWIFSSIAADGGKITEFSLNGRNILTGPEVNADYYGSSFIVGPEEAIGGFPPPAPFDFNDYSVAVDEVENRVILTGENYPPLKLQLKKTFTPNIENLSVDIVYTIINTGDVPSAWAPWEITRVAPNGLTFYPQGDGAPHVPWGTFDYIQTDRITWFKHDQSVNAAPGKLFSDGADGWIAHTDGKLVLIKVHEDIPVAEQAPDEAEIEIFSIGDYVEVEVLGAYTEIPAGGEVSWSTSWYLRELPQGMEATAGNKALVEFVERVIR
ncbi:MAG TPA: DUF4380 domain-containing protein [Pontiella sp.]|nr:DUF4380 domain-containing protein [Pontiella sp.]